MGFYKIKFNDGVDVTPDLIADATSFIEKYKNNSIKIRGSSEDDVKETLIAKINKDAESLDMPFRVVEADPEDIPDHVKESIHGKLGDIMERLGIRESLAETILKNVSDPMFFGSKTVEFSLMKYFEAFENTGASLPQVLSNFMSANFHEMGNAILNTISEENTPIYDELQRITMRLVMTITIDHYINDSNNCRMMKKFGFSKEELLQDLHAIGMNRSSEVISKLMEDYNTKIETISSDSSKVKENETLH